jgi:hypothetical protein
VELVQAVIQQLRANGRLAQQGSYTLARIDSASYDAEQGKIEGTLSFCNASP